MNGRGVSLLSLPVVAGLLAVLALVLIFLGRTWGLGTRSFLLLIVPLALAVAYLAWYRTLPYEPVRPVRARVAAPVAPDDEPFEDPVEEADRIEQAGAARPSSGEEADEATPGHSAPPTEDGDDDDARGTG